VKAVVHRIPEAWLEERRRLGHDRYDEMWEGVLYVHPMPSNPHQDLRDDLLGELEALAREGKVPGRWRTERNLAKPGGWPGDFRIPDLIYLGPQAACQDAGSHYDGPPDVVVEIAGEGDTSREKLPWYAELGVPEVWILDLKARQPEVLVRSGATYLKQRPDAEGWFASEQFPVELRQGDEHGRPVLELRAPGTSQARIAL